VAIAAVHQFGHTAEPGTVGSRLLPSHPTAVEDVTR
jgi:hypothetical protein